MSDSSFALLDSSFEMPVSSFETMPQSNAHRAGSDLPVSDVWVERRKILKAHKRDFPAGAIAKAEGDGSAATYCVLSGWLTVSKSMPDGGRQIVDVILPGEIIDPSSANGHTSSVQVEALSRATVAIVPRGVWSRLKESDAAIGRIETVIAAAALSRMSERMLRLGKGSAESRIAYALIELCMRLAAIDEGNDCAFHLPMTQQVLGDFVGLSSVQVCRSIRRLRGDGVISVAGRMDIVIHDIPALAEIAGADLEKLRGEIIAVSAHPGSPAPYRPDAFG